jgi:hypothetical protein
LSQKEIFLQGRCSREIGNVPIVEQKLPNFLSSRILTDQFIAENVMPKGELNLGTNRLKGD